VVVTLLAEFFFIGQTQLDPIWPVFLPVAGEKEWPDRVRPGLTNEKELSHCYSVNRAVIFQ